MGDPSHDFGWRLLHSDGLGLYTRMLTSNGVSYVLGVNKDMIDTTQCKFSGIILTLLLRKEDH